MTDDPRTISVSGSGSAEAAPDLMTLAIGVECRRDRVAEAFEDAGRAASAVTAALRGHGVPDADITTSGLNVRAEVGWQEGRGQVVSGYLASTTFSVRLHDPAASSALVAAAVEAGGDEVRLNGLELGFADPAAVQARARESAWADARTNAEHFAALAGARLGRVASVSMHLGPRAPVPLAGMQRTVASAALPVEAGAAGVSAAVDVVWELLD